jgi:hypothetical protein
MQIRFIGSLTLLTRLYVYIVALFPPLPFLRIMPIALLKAYVDVCHETYYSPTFLGDDENGNDDRGEEGGVQLGLPDIPLDVFSNWLFRIHVKVDMPSCIML